MKPFRFDVFKGAAGLLVILALLTAGVYAKDDPSAAEYHNAKKKLLQFEQSVEKRGMRENWINMIRLFDEILKKYPDGQYAAECRYNSARLYYELAKNSGAKKDVEKAQSELLSFFESYPDGRYSDDALYYAAEMAEKIQKKKEARLCLTKLVKRHKKGDFYAKAKKKLAALGGPLDEGEDSKKAEAKDEIKTGQKQTSAEKEKDGAEKKNAKADEAKSSGGDNEKKKEAEAPVDLAKKMVKIDEPPEEKKASETLEKAPAELSVLTSAAIEKKKNETVINLKFKGLVSFTKGDAPATKDKPYRLFLDFSPAKSGPGIKASVEVNSEFVIKMRAARYSETALRVVLDLRKETLYAEIFQQTKNNETVIKITVSDKQKTADGGAAASDEKKDGKQVEKVEEKKEVAAVKEEPQKTEEKDAKKEVKPAEKTLKAEVKSEEKPQVKAEVKTETKPEEKNKPAADEKNDKPAQKLGKDEKKTADKKKDEVESALLGDAAKNKLVEPPKDGKSDAKTETAKKDEPKETKNADGKIEGDKEPAKELKEIKDAKKDETKETKKEETPKPLPVPDKKDDIIKKIVEDATPLLNKDAAAKKDEKKEPKKEETKKSAEDYELPKELKVVTIDPGHGGQDWGAIGKHNTAEKDITLQISLKVKEKLEKKLPGVKVILTRSEDKSMKLKERTEIANNAGADLFVSIHCNATLSRKMYGIETFFLNMASQKYAEKLANRENAEIDSEEDELPYILADLITSANTDYSIKAATYVQNGMMAALKKKKYTQLDDRGVEPALLFVLLYAKMPSILVETSFISNLREEMRLRDPKYQDALAEGIVEGIYKYNIYLQDQAQ